jgi:hypothetical protein
MLSVADRQQGFLRAARCSGLLAGDSIYALLAEHGARIVRMMTSLSVTPSGMVGRRSRRARPRRGLLRRLLLDA